MQINHKGNVPRCIKYLNFSMKIQESLCIKLTCFKNETKNEKGRLLVQPETLCFQMLNFYGCGIRIRILPKQNESSNLEFLILRNKSTKQIFGKQAYKTNPQYESLDNRPTKQIHDTNL